MSPVGLTSLQYNAYRLGCKKCLVADEKQAR